MMRYGRGTPCSRVTYGQGRGAHDAVRPRYAVLQGNLRTGEGGCSGSFYRVVGL